MILFKKQFHNVNLELFIALRLMIVLEIVLKFNFRLDLI